MPRCLGCRLLPCEIIPELPASLLILSDHSGNDNSLVGKEVPQTAPSLDIFVDPFGNDVAGPGKSFLSCGYPLARINILFRFKWAAILAKDGSGQRFKPFFHGDYASGPTLGSMRQVEVFKGCQILGCGNCLVQLLVQQITLAQGGNNRLPSFLEFSQLQLTVPDGGYLYFIQQTSGLFSVPGDERHRAALPAAGQQRPPPDRS
jgi:hypothetical protein